MAEAILPNFPILMRNRYEIRGDHVAIFLKKRSGQVFECLIDTSDFAKVAALKGSWCVNSEARGPYAILNLYSYERGGFRRRLDGRLMHRVIMDAPQGAVVDHIDPQRTLDNRRSNLRIATYTLNALNRRELSVERVGAGWEARLGFRGHYYRIGIFESEEMAKAAKLGARNLAIGLESLDVAKSLNGVDPA